MNVLVTGGCGYIGGRLSQYLAESGHHVSVLCRKAPVAYNGWMSLMTEVIEGDISKASTMDRLLQNDYDTIIHLVSLDHTESNADPVFVSSINVLPVWRLLHGFTQKGLKQFVNFSSIQVYGHLGKGVVSEEIKPSPQNSYGLTHLLSENICDYFNGVSDTVCTSIRLSNGFGSPVFQENDCWKLVINDLCKNAFFNHNIPLLSDGSPQRDFIHLSDVCRAVGTILEPHDNSQSKGGVLHVASERTMTILELACQVKLSYEKRYNKEIPIVLPDKTTVEPDAGLSTRAERFQIDTSKIKSMGYSSGINLDGGIDELFSYFENSTQI